MTVPFADILFGRGALFIRDLSRYYYPTKKIVREVIRAGEMPFWNPYYSAGQPMAANPEYEVFYPPQWLILLPDYDVGYRLHVLVHFWIAVLGAYALCRGRRFRVSTSALGATAFALGGFFISTVNLLPIMFCAAWIPAIMHFGHRFLAMRRARDLCIAALLLGVQMLAGEPTTLLQTWSLLGFLAVWRSLRHGWNLRRLVIGLLLVLAMGVAGALIGGAQMIPAADHAGDSVRARGFDFGLVQAWSMTPWRPLELLFPNLFGHIWLDGSLFWGSGLYQRTGSPFYFTIYPGLFITAFGVAALVLRRTGWLMAALLIAGSVVLALGVHTPLLRALYDAGIFSAVRYPEKFSLTALLVLLLMGTAALDRAIRGDQVIMRAAAVIVALSVIGAAVAVTLTLLPQYPQWFRVLWGVKTARLQEMLSVARLEWLVALGRGMVALVIMELWRRRGDDRWIGTVAVLALAADLSWTGRSSVPRVDPAFYTPPPLAAEIRSTTARHRLFHEIDWYGSSTIARKYFSSGSSVYWIVRNGVYPMTPAAWGIGTVLERDYDRTALLPTTDLVDSMWKVRDRGQERWREMFMTMSNARVSTQYEPFEEQVRSTGGDLRKAAPVKLAPSENAAPRYYFAESVAIARTPDEFVDRLVEERWSERMAYLDSPMPAPSPGRLADVRETFNTIEMDVVVDGPAEGLLVASVTPHKYWSATIDGRPAALRVVNIGYIGLPVPPGAHRVSLVYRNPLVITFALIAIVSAACFVVIAAWPRRRRYLR